MSLHQPPENNMWFRKTTCVWRIFQGCHQSFMLIMLKALSRFRGIEWHEKWMKHVALAAVTWMEKKLLTDLKNILAQLRRVAIDTHKINYKLDLAFLSDKRTLPSRICYVSDGGSAAAHAFISAVHLLFIVGFMCIRMTSASNSHQRNGIYNPTLGKKANNRHDLMLGFTCCSQPAWHTTCIQHMSY